MKTSITMLIGQEINDISGGTFASRAKESGVFLVNVAAPFIGLVVGLGVFLLLIEEMKEREREE